MNLELEFIKNYSKLLGAIKYHINKEEKECLLVELMSDEALKTSKIEDEILDRDCLQSFIRRHFVLQTENRKVPSAEQGLQASDCNLIIVTKIFEMLG